jgi:hypothetical protein
MNIFINGMAEKSINLKSTYVDFFENVLNSAFMNIGMKEMRTKQFKVQKDTILEDRPHVTNCTQGP